MRARALALPETRLLIFYSRHEKQTGGASIYGTNKEFRARVGDLLPPNHERD